MRNTFRQYGTFPGICSKQQDFYHSIVCGKSLFLCFLPKKREEYQVSFSEFMRIGVPYTLVAVLTGYLYLWFVWA